MQPHQPLALAKRIEQILSLRVTQPLLDAGVEQDHVARGEHRLVDVVQLRRDANLQVAPFAEIVGELLGQGVVIMVPAAHDHQHPHRGELG